MGPQVPQASGWIYMPKALVVVESPAKAKTINRYLGGDFKVVASMGHIRDLPKSKLGVDIDRRVSRRCTKPIPPPARQVIKELRRRGQGGPDTIYVATDPDREGEAIGWHLANELGSKRRKIGRLMFNEITQHGNLSTHSRKNGRLTSRWLTRSRPAACSTGWWATSSARCFGTRCSRGLSAGRVQSVALKLVCDRENGRLTGSNQRNTGICSPGSPVEDAARIRRQGGQARETGAKGVERGRGEGRSLSDLQERQSSWLAESGPRRSGRNTPRRPSSPASSSRPRGSRSRRP